MLRVLLLTSFTFIYTGINIYIVIWKWKHPENDAFVVKTQISTHKQNWAVRSIVVRRIFCFSSNNCVEMQLLCKLNWELQKKRFRIPDGSLPKNYISVEVNSVFEDFNHFAPFYFSTNKPTDPVNVSLISLLLFSHPFVICLYEY